MLDLLEFVRNTLKDDTTIKSYVGDPARIYLAYKPILDSAGTSYPQITMNATDGMTDSVTNTCNPTLYLDVWTKTAAGVGGATTAKLIAKRIYQLLDSVSNLPVSGLNIYQIWKNAAVLVFEADTETWHLSINFFVQMDGYEKT